MKKKINKEKELKLEIARLNSSLSVLRQERDKYSGFLGEVKKILGGRFDHYSAELSDIPKEVMRLVLYKEVNQGAMRTDYEHARSLERILRWTINPECARDEEKMLRFDEDMKKRGLL